ncbi:MAG: PAS domain-containing protein [Spirochaetia bacterium]|nr:PAS domain-containing protein [Spirochaetia bacterium]
MDNYHSKDMLNKISELNNQLTNMSRDLNKKNYHLKEEIERRYIAEKNLRTLLNATEDIIVLIQSDKTILDSNMGFAGFVDREYDALIGMNYIEVLPATLQESISAVFHKATQECVSTSCEEHVNGHWYEFTFYPLTDTENNLERIACYQRDTTERKEMYSYLVNAGKQETAETIVSGIADHDDNIMTVPLRLPCHY